MIANQAFPRVDDRRAGLPYRYGWVQLARPGGNGKDINGDSMLSKYDVTTGTRVDHDFGAGKQLGEPVFVPREGSTAEDDGYVMTYMWDKAEGRSSFVILSGQDFAGDPIAQVHVAAACAARLPRLVGAGLSRVRLSLPELRPTAQRDRPRCPLRIGSRLRSCGRGLPQSAAVGSFEGTGRR